MLTDRTSTRTALRVRPHRAARGTTQGVGERPRLATLDGAASAAGYGASHGHLRETGRRTGHRGLAAEAHGAYESSDRPAAVGPDVTASSNVTAPPPPFGLPVLAELPELAAALEGIVAGERALLRAVATLARVVDTGEVEASTGVSVEHWLGIVARQTRLDRRLLLRTCRLLGRLPTLRSAVETGQVSFAQLRGLVLGVRGASAELDGPLDELLGRLLPELRDADPDALVDQMRRAVDELEPATAPAETDDPTNHLYVQPNLAGTGGRFNGELDAIGLAILDEATAPTRRQLDHPGGAGGARADNLLARLAHECVPHEPPAADQHRDRSADDPDGAADGGYRASRTLDVLPGLPPVKLLARIELETLLDATRVPTELLTRLTGGRLRLSSAAARRLLDERGVELRTVVVDQGAVVGIGRSSRQPPGWLRDGILAVHDTCTGPLCERPARGTDTDHARPWTPNRPHQLPGATDVDNLGPLCAATNREKERAGWHATQTPDGRRTWTHPRTGLAVTTIPSTWRPPATGPPANHPGQPRAPDRWPADPTCPF